MGKTRHTELGDAPAPLTVGGDDVGVGLGFVVALVVFVPVLDVVMLLLPWSLLLLLLGFDLVALNLIESGCLESEQLNTFFVLIWSLSFRSFGR